jgi:hypothetical protein
MFVDENLKTLGSHFSVFLIRSYQVISSSPTGSDFFQEEEIQRKAQA